MDSPASTAVARDLLDAFAERTGLVSGGRSPRVPRRYLWTDAFAVCTWLSLHGRTGDARFLDLARRLVAQVHRVLGRHREDDARTGWISGLSEAEGERHPTAGGLRIGKPLPERGDGEPLDPELEWERDGQYFHYLTRWMHALHRMAVATGESDAHRLAAELARVAQDRFTRGPPGARRLVWKMSIDLSRPLVPSMGHHDPLDGLVTLAALEASPARAPHSPGLREPVLQLEEMCAGRGWATDDPLGIGGLLTDALRVGLLVAAGARERRGLLAILCEDGSSSLAAYTLRSPLTLPLEHRLPFRELGLAIGLHAVERLESLVERGALDPELAPAVRALAAHVPLAGALEAAWRAPAARRVPTWSEHEDINAVMLAASLAPEGYLGA